MKNFAFISDNFRADGTLLESFHKMAVDVDSHTTVQRIDFRTGDILHFDAADDDGLKYRRIPTLKSRIYKKDKKGDIVLNDYYHVGEDELKEDGIGFVMNEVECSSENHTAFLCDIDTEDSFVEVVLFMGETASKTFQIRMPVADSHSTLGRDIYLAEKLNDLDEMEAKGDQHVLKVGECYCTIRKSSEDSHFGKIVSFFGLGKTGHEHKRQSFDSIYSSIRELEKKYGKAECVKWTMDAKYVNVIVSFEDLTKKMEEMNPGLGYKPVYIFRTSDTGHVASAVKAGWDINGQVVACGVDAPKEKATRRRDRAADPDDMFDFVKACEEETRVHEMLASEFSGEEDIIDDDELDCLLSTAVRKSGMEKKAGSIATKAFLNGVKELCETGMTKKTLRNAVAESIVSKCFGSVSEYAEKMLTDDVAGMALASF